MTASLPAEHETKHTAEGLLAMLRVKYAPPAFAIISEVPNATSFDKSRSCDAMAFGCWKSEGILIHGFEIKVSRGDWLSELQDRSKAATFEPFCHHWWIVAAPGVVKLEELPGAWGLMEPSGNGLKIRSAADLRMPQPVSTQMLAAFMRRACTQAASQAELKAARDAGYSEGRKQGVKQGVRESGQDHLTRDRDSYKQRLELLQASVDAFEAASGLTIYAYGGKQLGKQFAAFQRLMDHRPQNELHNVSKLAESLKTHAEDLLAALAATKGADE